MSSTGIILALSITLASSFTLTPPNDSSVFIEDIQETYLYHNDVRIIVGIDLKPYIKLDENIVEHYSRIKNVCDPENCTRSLEIQSIFARINILKTKIIHLKSLLHMRTKRGLLNFVGSISKTLFGTLDEDDLNLINENMDKLFDQQNTMNLVLQNQTAIIKTILNYEIQNSQHLLKKHIRNSNQITTQIIAGSCNIRKHRTDRYTYHSYTDRQKGNSSPRYSYQRSIFRRIH